MVVVVWNQLLINVAPASSISPVVLIQRAVTVFSFQWRRPNVISFPRLSVNMLIFNSSIVLNFLFLQHLLLLLFHSHVLKLHSSYISGGTPPLPVEIGAILIILHSYYVFRISYEAIFFHTEIPLLLRKACTTNVRTTCCIWWSVSDSIRTLIFSMNSAIAVMVQYYSGILKPQLAIKSIFWAVISRFNWCYGEELVLSTHGR